MAKQAPKAAKAEAPKVDIANINRTSDVQMVDYVHTMLMYGDPEVLADIVDPSTVDAIKASIKEAGDLFSPSVEAAVQRALDTKVEAAVRALTNTAPLTGYAGREFNAETFMAKVTPKPGRKRLSPEEKAAKVVSEATPEQLDALRALLKERGIDPEAL